MKYIYFMIADTTKNREEYAFQSFFKVYSGNDLAGYLQSVSETNNTPIDKLRLYVYGTKKVWERMAADHYEICRKANAPIF